MLTTEYFESAHWDKTYLDGNQVLDKVEDLDDELATIYLKCLDLSAMLIQEKYHEQVVPMFIQFANHLQGGEIETIKDIRDEAWAGYHPIVLLFSRLRWYGEDGSFHYTDSDTIKDSEALKEEISLAQQFHEWLPSNWLTLSETGGKGTFGKVVQLSEARYAFDTQQDLAVDQIIVLSGMNRRSVQNAISKTGEIGLLVNDKGVISYQEAVRWLNGRRNFTFTKIYHPKEAENKNEQLLQKNEDTGYAFIPVTDDGVAFLPDLKREHGYQIGKYGQEEYVSDYFRALEKLQAMDTPRFRRPNKQDNWGIKVGMIWRRIAVAELDTILNNLSNRQQFDSQNQSI